MRQAGVDKAGFLPVSISLESLSVLLPDAFQSRCILILGFKASFFFSTSKKMIIKNTSF